MAEQDAGTATATVDAPAAAATTQNGATAPAATQAAPTATVPEWRQQIPEAIRGDKLWDRYKDPAAAFQSLHEAQKAIGGMVKKPGPDAKPEEVAAFREKMGVPKDASGYKPPEGVPLDQPRWEKWTGHAHKLGLTPEQLTGLATLEAEERQGAVDGARQEWIAGAKQLEAEWGPELYAKNVTLAARAIDRHMSPEGKQFLDDTGLGNHPEWIKAWASVGALLAEDGYIEGRIVGVPGREEAQAQITAIIAQGLKHPANNPELPGHKEARAALDNLFKLVHGTGTA
jgi:hypothetical protein